MDKGARLVGRCGNEALADLRLYIRACQHGPEDPEPIGWPLSLRSLGLGLAPTAFAEARRGALGPLLEQLGGLTRREAFAPATARRSFRLVWSDYLQLVVGGPWIPALRKAAPSVDLRSLPPTSPGVISTLRECHADLAFDVGLSDPGDLRGHFLFADRFMSFSAAHTADSQMTINEFVAASHILVAPQGGSTGPVGTALSALGHKRRVACHLSHFMGVAAMVQDSDLVVTLPHRLLLALGAPESSLFLPPVPVQPLRVRVVWHPRTGGDAGILWLRQHLQSFFARLRDEEARS